MNPRDAQSYLEFAYRTALGRAAQFLEAIAYRVGGMRLLEA